MYTLSVTHIVVCFCFWCQTVQVTSAWRVLSASAHDPAGPHNLAKGDEFLEMCADLCILYKYRLCEAVPRPWLGDQIKPDVLYYRSAVYIL